MTTAAQAIHEDIEAVLPVHDRSLLYGPPGTGKTHLAENALDDPNRPVYSITMTAESPAEALTGHYVVVGGGRFLHIPGPATRAWTVPWTDSKGGARVGGRLVVNEVDKPRGDAQDALHVILDGTDVAVLTLPVLTPQAERRLIAEREGGASDQEWRSTASDLAEDLVSIKPGADFQAICTMNGVPLDLTEACETRLTVQYEVLSPSDAAIAALPEDLRQLARLLAGTKRADGRWWSLRPFFAYADLREKVPAPVAGRAIFGDEAESLLDSLAVGAA